MENEQQYQAFISWQCRLRKMSMRELEGRPTKGMSAGVYSISGGEEQSRMNFIITRKNPRERTDEFRHIVRKSSDPSQWVKNGLRVLAEMHYQQDKEFDHQLTALFSLDSTLADALIKAGECHLKFAQDSIEQAFDFDVVLLDQDDDMFQATYWHNRIFNPTLPGKVRVLGFRPRL